MKELIENQKPKTEFLIKNSQLSYIEASGSQATARCTARGSEIAEPSNLIELGLLGISAL